MRCFIPKFIIILMFFALFAFVPFKANAQTGHNFASTKSDSGQNVPVNSNPAKQWVKYYKDDAKHDYKSMMAFITKHPDFPAMGVLREKAEKSMPSSMSDAEVLSWFSKNPPETIFGMRLYANALIKSGQQEAAKSAINTWWSSATLTKEDQQNGYGFFKSQLSRTTNQDRLRILIYREQYTNARHLARVMGDEFLNYTEARIALRTGKGNPDQYLSRVPQSLQNDEGLLFDLLVFRRKSKNDSGAVEILSKSPSSTSMHDSEDWGRERGIIARRYFEKGQYSKAYQISANHKTKDGTGFSANEWFAGWVALEFLKNPQTALKHFEKLYNGVESPISKSRAAYWAGRANQDMKSEDIADKWYGIGSKYQRTFYGQLSLAELGQSPNVAYTASPKSNFGSSDLGNAAKWLRQNGYKSEAGMFLNKMIDMAKTPSDFAAVSDLANDINMKNLAIKSAQESEKKTGVAQVSYAFPKLDKYLKDIDVEWALVHSLIRQESRYDQEAISHAGARGLMQLMPATAFEVAKKANIPHQKEWLISKPAHNINLGSLYFQRLLNNYNGNYAMALAGYNAGPGRVSEWVKKYGDPRNPSVDLINWIEMIPIYETRNYVQRVLEGVYVYRKILDHNGGKKPTNITHIAAQ